jgi:hypothetical protein
MPKFRKEIPDMTIRRLLALAVVLLMGGVAAAHGQSLADLAAKEEARRKQTKKPAKVYTNKDVKGNRADAPAPAGAAPAGSTAPARSHPRRTPRRLKARARSRRPTRRRARTTRRNGGRA